MARLLLICATPPVFNLETLQQASLSGTETANVELAAQLALRGHDVTLATRTDAVLVRSDRLRNIPLADAAGERPDFVISSKESHVFDAWGPGAPARVLWVHNPLILHRLLRRRQLGPIRRHRPLAIFPSVTARDATSPLLPFARRSVILHGVSDCFHTAPPATGRSPFVVWASEAYRGLRETIGVWRSRIRPRVAAAEFHIFTKYSPDLGARDELQRDGIIFHARCAKTELAGFYRQARAMLYPGAPDETFCLAAAEAQCMGIPLVTIGRGALRERVRTGIDGLLCADPQQAGDAVVRLLEDDAFWSTLNAGALSLRGMLTWERAARAWEWELGIG